MSARYRTLFYAITLSLTACADDSAPIEGRDDTVNIEDSGRDTDSDTDEPDAAVEVEVDAAVGTDAAVDVDATVEIDAAVEVDAEVDAAVEVISHLPCDVEAILAASCQRCHGPTAKNGVPLITRDDLLAPSPADATVTVISRVLARVVEIDKPMPPMGRGDPISAENRAVLESWVEQGSPVGSCE